MKVVRTGGRYTFPLSVRSAYRRCFDPGELDLVVEDINKLPLFTPWWAEAPIVGLVPHLFGTTAFRQESAPVAAAVWAAERLVPFVYRDVPFQAISESTARDLAARGIARERIEVIPPGIDHGTYGPDPATPRYESPTVVYVGRLVRYKGLAVVISAVRRVREDGLPLRLLIAGRGEDRPRLETVVAREGVEDGVEFLGFVPEERKVELLRRAWANVYPSPKEGWGITNVEAAACGTPSVASDSPGLRESVVDGESGILVPHGRPEAWASALERLCRDPDLRGRLGRGALRHAARFSWERAADETEASLRRHAETGRRTAVSGGPDGG